MHFSFADASARDPRGAITVKRAKVAPTSQRLAQRHAAAPPARKRTLNRLVTMSLRAASVLRRDGFG
jgi:hypothetical protein